MSLTEAERTEVLRRTVTYEASWNRARVELVESFMAVLVYTRNANHVLHVLLSVLTCGMWLIMWVCLMMLEKPEYRKVITVDPYGRVTWSTSTKQKRLAK